MAYEIVKEKLETGKCLLCHDAPCTKACPAEVPAARIIRALRFKNTKGAACLMPKRHPCVTCDNPVCMEACNRKKMGDPVEIQEVLGNVNPEPNIEQADLSINFCGVRCENPFFLSSSIVGSNYEMVAKAFDVGWAGVAFKTIGTFVPQEVSPRFDRLAKENNPMIGFKNIEQISDHTLEENLGYLKNLKRDYPTKIIIASIMGQNEEEWTYLAGEMERVGADIIECNFSCPHMSGEGLGSDVGTNPELVALYTAATKRGTSLPVLAKMTPNITNMEVPALAAVKAGADGIAAINTIKSVMNINLQTYVSGPDVIGKSSVGGYSGKAVKPIALRFIHDIKSNPGLKDIPVSGMGGIENWIDGAEFIALGCETVQITTAVMEYGYRIIDDLLDGLSNYMGELGIGSVKELVGRALPNLLPAEKLNRSSICYPKFNRNLCVGCGRCYLSCYDAGHQALSMGKDRKPVMDAKKCVGCHLCRIVCPAEAISPGVRIKLEERKEGMRNVSMQFRTNEG
ncbi:NAD-dependent dihydropyrimidine dehydrogenase subunit PreA [Muricomes intestini]|uniref:NAD-dependent dihydropyrimidine dehydrogenase subunit PreA n=1 Tax=Muricomes intestini TaxID=1796634 RepID=UPI002FD9BB45